MLDVQVDEFTLVLQSKKRPAYIEQWDDMATAIIDEFNDLAKIEVIFNELEEVNHSLPQGYSKGFICKNVPFYFSIAYHTDFVQMGVCIKFSAYSWSVYRKNYQELFSDDIQIHQFIKQINSTNLYTSRLSRIDIAIDFLEEKVNVNTIYNQLSKKNQMIKNNSGRKNSSTLSAITKNNITSTFYIGSKGKNIKSFLRVYDKKQEQIETMGFRYQEAIQSNNWIRFEAVFRGEYAHSISEELLLIKNNNELKNLFVSTLTDRYQFYYSKSGKLTRYSKKMIDLLYQKTFTFKTPSPRNNLLNQSVEYLVNGSGLFPTLWKVNEIWGNGTDWELIIWIFKQYYDSFEPNDDHIGWVKKYRPLYIKEGKPWV